ncbi:MAG TPA: SCO family protein, partial [Solirubrobacteraceae bacterium]
MRLRPWAMFALTLLALALGGCAGGGGAKRERFEGAAYPPGVRAPDFTLRDEHGRPVSLSGYRGKVVALSFLSSACKTCALVAQQIRGALDELGSPPGVSTIFVSTDPRGDTAARVARFLAATSLTGRALYLTGTESKLEDAWLAYHVTRNEDGITV